MRICEELYYHCQYDSRYIDELNKALKETGIIPENTVDIKYSLKDDFKAEDLYQTGFVFKNRRVEKAVKMLMNCCHQFEIESIVFPSILDA